MHARPTQEYSEDDLVSATQAELWNASILNPGPLYAIAFSIHFKFRVDAKELFQATSQAILSHEIFRTTYIEKGGKLIRRLFEGVLFDERTEIFYEQKITDDQLNRYARQLAKAPFSLEGRDLLFRTRIVSDGDGTAAVICAIHHLCFDGLSIQILSDDIRSIYNNRIIPSRSAFGSYCERERLAIGSEKQRISAKYWEDEKKKIVEMDHLQVELRNTQSTNASDLTIRLSEDEMEKLDYICRTECITMPTALLACISRVLNRYQRHDPVGIAFPIQQRFLEEDFSTIGPMINTSLIVVEQKSDPSIREYLQQVNEKVLTALDHSGVNYKNAVRLPSGNESSSASLKSPQMMLNYSTLATATEVKETVRIVQGIDRESKYPIVIYANRFQDNFTLNVYYRNQMFQNGQIQTFLKHLREMINEVHFKVGELESELKLPVVQEEQSDEVNATCIPLEINDLAKNNIVDLLYQKHWDSDSVAIRQGCHELTYRDLLKSVIGFSKVLDEGGLGRGDRVALVGTRDENYFVAMLAIFSIGAIFTPIDELTISKRKGQANEPWLPKGLIGLDVEVDQIGLDLELISVVRQFSAGEFSNWFLNTGIEINNRSIVSLDLDDPCYLYLTSGSTGEPKVVLGKMASLISYVDWFTYEFGLNRDDLIPQLTSPTFDPFLREVFSCFFSGAKLCLPEVEALRAPRECLSWLSNEGATAAFLVPSLVKQWMGSNDTSRSLSLRLSFFAGELLTERTILDWSRFVSAQHDAVNLYGPTETTMSATYYRIPKSPITDCQPIGRCRPNTHIVVVDRKGNQCAIGQVGEIVIHTFMGTILEFRPRESNKLLPGTMPANPQIQTHRTGDYGFLRSDGELQLLGRKDDQVKVNGRRINMAAIQEAICSRESIQDCVVLCESAKGQFTLTAFVISTNESDTSASIQKWLLGKLHYDLVPSRVLFLDSIPLTDRGKIDKLEIKHCGIVRQNAETALNDPVEIFIQQCFGDLCKTQEKIIVDDNFFSIGGTSLSLHELRHRINQKFGTDISYRETYLNPTLKQLTALVREKFQSTVRKIR